MRSDTSTEKKGKTSFVLIGYERSEKYKIYNRDLVRKVTRKYDCPFKLRAKPVSKDERWMINLICGIHNHALTKSFTGHPYVDRLTEDEKIYCW